VQPHQHPDSGTVSVKTPITVEVAQLEIANHKVGDAKERKYHQPDLHSALVTFTGAAAVPFVGNEADEKDAEVEGAPEERGRVLMRGPLDRAGMQVKVDAIISTKTMPSIAIMPMMPHQVRLFVPKTMVGSFDTSKTARSTCSISPFRADGRQPALLARTSRS
jgi:hypothetical protein